MSNIAIHVKNISKFFSADDSKSIFTKFKKSNSNALKSIRALDDVSFDIQTGEILGIIGVNGSGKSTLLRIIAGILQPDLGKIEVHGKISALLQLGVGFNYELNAKENIILNGLLIGVSKSEIHEKVEKIIDYAELKKFTNLKLKHYSSGMRARLGFSTALMFDPDIFLVDEILSVGDRNFRKKSYQAFLKLKEKNKTILLTTHNMSHLSEIADRVLLLHNGKIKKIGKPVEVIKEYLELKPSNQ